MNNRTNRFGYRWLTEFNAKKLHSKNINVYVVYYSFCTFQKKLVESPMLLFSKKDLKNHSKTIDEKFDDAKREIELFKIFPNLIMESFYFTDDRTVVPKEHLISHDYKPKKIQKQLVLF